MYSIASAKDLKKMIKPGQVRRISSALVGLAICAITASSRGDKIPPCGAESLHQTPESKTAEQVYKNIQVLGGLPASQLDGVMYFMSASLGVGCAYCHTSQLEGDEKSAKLTTRRMIQMMR